MTKADQSYWTAILTSKNSREITTILLLLVMMRQSRYAVEPSNAATARETKKAAAMKMTMLRKS